ncbi:MAG TPA: hypothetical protein VK694_01430 [Verrucomicrobiae bacterium]|nr:hypothetical protein [Verrucomicrobiae bacterium]
MKNTTPTAIRLSITSDVRKSLDMAKKRYPALSDPEILKLGLSKLVTEYDKAGTLAEDRKEIRLGASAAIGKDYLKDSEENIYSVNVGKKVHFS